MDLAKIALGLLAAVTLVAGGGAALAKSPTEEVNEIRSDFLSDAVKARAEYRRELQKAAKRAVNDFEKAAASAVRAGDLAAATSAMRQILWLDRDHKQARAHFEAIGQLDEVLKELEEEPVIPQGESEATARLEHDLTGTSWTWGKNQITFLPGGVANVTGDPKPNSRLWRVDGDGNIYVAPTTGKSIAVIKADLGRGGYGGKNYELLSPNFTGRRVR